MDNKYPSKRYFESIKTREDYDKFIASMPENVLTIKFREDTIQPEPKRKHLLATNWKDVYNICTNKEEK